MTGRSGVTSLPSSHAGDHSHIIQNSSHLPVDYTTDIFDALDIQDELQTLYTSGTVFHAFLGEKLPDWKAAANLVRTIAEHYRLPYYTMSPHTRSAASMAILQENKRPVLSAAV